MKPNPPRRSREELGLVGHFNFEAHVNMPLAVDALTVELAVAVYVSGPKFLTAIILSHDVHDDLIIRRPIFECRVCWNN